ncbi:hypothetical protein E5676_scaffold271G00490 [Cucumis melo var. makuwa]|uniref:Transmembrane protein n=2 Tax=Cucumis melo TaxID=3656 RepID=A0A5D3BAD8_CUCMM|nr:hypothetical protein E6C27_scaffold57G001740 [Cucumis melo var. makuwa]TYJ95979.1 hypothetical protein E5676_scaffold271G00490 [Cucumis melo var. makuwa]
MDFPFPFSFPHKFISMADPKPLHVLLIMAPLLLLLASQLNSIFAQTDSPTPPNLPQQTINKERLPSSDPHLSPPLSNQRAARNNTKAHRRDQLAGTRLSLKRLRSNRDSIRKRRRRNHLRAWHRSYSSRGCLPTVSLLYIWFGILWSISA